MPITISKPAAAKAADKAAEAGAKAAPEPAKTDPAPVAATAKPKGIAGLKASVAAPKAKVEVEVKDGDGKVVSHETDYEAVAMPAETKSVVEQAPCVVNYSLGYTHGLPNYCSAKGSVSLSIPCRHDEIEQTADYVKEWVDGRLTTLAGEIMAMAAPAE